MVRSAGNEPTLTPGCDGVTRANRWSSTPQGRSPFVEGITGSDLTGIFSDFLFRKALKSRSGPSSSPEAYHFHRVGQQAPLRGAKGIQDRHEYHDDGDAN